MNIKLLFFPLSMIILVWSVIGITKPAWDDYKMQKVELDKLVTERQGLEKGIMNIKKALLEYNNLDDSTKNYVNNAIPVDGDDDNLVAELNKNISQSGILVVKIGVSKQKAKINPKCRQKDAAASGLNCSEKASSMGVTLSAAGLYPKIKEFLGKLDVQNRIVVPKTVTMSASNNKKENEDSDIKLITAKINFDVFQKKPVKIKSFSSIMTSDAVLRSLLSKGLDTDGIEIVKKFITSEIFVPVKVDGVGKSNLFEKGSAVQAQEVVAVN